MPEPVIVFPVLVIAFQVLSLIPESFPGKMPVMMQSMVFRTAIVTVGVESSKEPLGPSPRFTSVLRLSIAPRDHLHLPEPHCKPAGASHYARWKACREPFRGRRDHVGKYPWPGLHGRIRDDHWNGIWPNRREGIGALCHRKS